jgi:hypothetical protein
MRRLCLLLLIPLVVAAGCTEKPRAPALQTGAEYDNPHIGLRLPAPTNWSEVARADKPRPGSGEHLLVRFQAPLGKTRAVFEVTLDQKPESDDVAMLVRQPSHAAPSWDPVTEPAPLNIGGVSAMRYTLKNKNTMKEVVAVRRDGKLFLFTLIAALADTPARDQIRQAIDGLTWTK